ncbi:MAG: DUF1836 domain-containing protein [Lachnospiraceae bacterium]|nr:DUF1836 domain-containing protein [Lachnospiraceae bacterium]
MIDSEKLLDDILNNLNIINETDIPSIDLYMDQVTTFMDKHLKSSKRFDEDKILTKTMINNYSKNELLPAPIKKRYTKEHVILLIFIYYYKNILSINDIKTILSPLCDSYFGEEHNLSLEQIYNEISRMQHDMIDTVKQDITDKIADSKKHFCESPKKDREFLQLYALVSSLCFDVYIKKQMIEGIIDKMNETSNSDET